MKDLGDGVSLESFNDDPPMVFYGKIGAWCYALYWWKRDWVFVVDPELKKVLLWPYMPDLRFQIPWSKLSVQFQKFSPLEHADRPTGTAHVVAEMREIIRSCAKEFRESLGPREWSPRWPQSKGSSNG